MKTQTLAPVLAWGIVINYALLTLWFLVFIFAHDWMRDMHGRWFHLTGEQFDLANYLGLIFYKIGIMLLFLTPYLGIRIAARSEST